MIWFPLALSAALCWAVGAVLVKQGFSSVPPLWNNIINNLLAVLLWIPVVLLLSRSRITIPPIGILAVILAASIPFQLFYYSLSRGQVSLTGTVIAIYPMITILLSHLFLGERLAGLQYVAIGLILAGSLAVAFPNRNQLLHTAGLGWLPWGLVGALSIGTGDFLSKLSINQIGSYSHIFFLSLTALGLSGINYLIDKPNRPPPRVFKRSFMPTLFGILLNLAGALCFLLAFDYGPVSLISPVSSVYPALLALLAVKFLKDKVSPIQGIGIGVITGGLITIGFSGF
ncbi:MAG: DMT family transporter [Spirochaetaceae bacterium]|nr:MAG: DMT family transporter [Spirochaetaceae bacterium]